MKKKSNPGFKEELASWWNNQTSKIRKEVLKEARFHPSDIKEYKLYNQSIGHLESTGWGIESILSARLRLGYNHN
jgi:hypothetical protein